MAKIESKRDRFVRVAEARTNKIIDMILLLGNCANKSTYDYTDKDIADIFNTIEKEVKTAKLKFGISGERTNKFKLEK